MAANSVASSQVLGKIGTTFGGEALEIEIAVPVHEASFHGFSRSRNWAEVRRYFSATEIA